MPVYLKPFLAFASNEMQVYATQLQSGANPNWKLKEALLFAVGCLS